MLFKIPKVVPEDLKFDIKSIPEEIANMISHGIGILLAILALPFLLYLSIQSGKTSFFFASLIYAISVLMVYTSSTLYHSVYSVRLRRFLRTMDHISIYFLIAGSYTPIIVMHIHTTAGWIVLCVLWAMVAVGTVFKMFYTHKFKVVSTLAYLVMGWLAVFIIKPIMELLPPDSLKWIVVGGAFYTLGAIFYLWKSLRYNHFIWHLFVLGGSIAHFVAVIYAVLA